MSRSSKEVLQNILKRKSTSQAADSEELYQIGRLEGKAGKRNQKTETAMLARPGRRAIPG